MANLTCPLCGSKNAEIRTTVPKGQKRKVKPKAFLYCPDNCGSLFSNRAKFGEVLQAKLAAAQAQAEKDLADNDSDKNKTLSDNNHQLPPKSGGSFLSNWGTLL